MNYELTINDKLTIVEHIIPTLNFTLTDEDIIDILIQILKEREE